jgi:hypothetical protein
MLNIKRTEERRNFLLSLFSYIYKFILFVATYIYKGS